MIQVFDVGWDETQTLADGSRGQRCGANRCIVLIWPIC